MSNYCRIISSNPVFLASERRTFEDFEREFPDSIFEIEPENNYLELQEYQVNSCDWLVPEFEEIISWLADGSWFVIQNEGDIFVSLFVKDREIHCEDYEFTSPFHSKGSNFWEGVKKSAEGMKDKPDWFKAGITLNPDIYETYSPEKK